MDGKLDAVVNSIGLSMAINKSYIVDCVLRPADWDQCLQAMTMLFEHDDSLPDIIFTKQHQLVLENGSELNNVGGGRVLRGRRPNVVVFDEVYGKDLREDLVITRAPVIMV